MRIGILAYHFPPEPAFLVGSLAEELAARGHEVRVLTGFPDYPGGHVYPGWRQRWHHETHSLRLTVRRVPRFPRDDGTVRGRMAAYLSFAAGAGLVARRYLRGVDVLYVHQVPAATLATVAVGRVLGSVPTVLHVQDVWADAETLGGGEAARRWSARLAGSAARAYRAADRLAVTAPSLREPVVAAGGDPQRIRLVPGWTDDRLFRPVAPSPAARRLVGADRRCLVMHAGTIGVAEGLATAVRAAASLESKMQLVLVGSGGEESRVRRLAGELGTGNIRFLPRRSALDMPELSAAADYHLVAARDLPELRGRVPGKLTAALSCAVPVVAAAAGDTAQIVERARAGLSCPPEDWTALADRFWLASTIPESARVEMGRRGRDTYLREMSMRAGVDRVERLLHEAVASRQEGFRNPVRR
ncbi:glycosyltransferase family 4 protein [Micromonospora sp. SH-82]|uniref:glycosyltransferase family 4 protein n=1 Tax=Micromonospora sp. SH-82 TaxID=3132938 RepID=UPI003EBF8210